MQLDAVPGVRIPTKHVGVLVALGSQRTDDRSCKRSFRPELINSYRLDNAHLVCVFWPGSGSEVGLPR
jgi:hypothetical protein